MSVLPFISVVLATYNRADVLAQTLAAYATQNYPAGRWQMIIVDDGSSDDTPAVLTDAVARYPQLLITAHHQANAGQGQARNWALQHLHADTDIVLFTGDDIIPADDTFLQQHAEAHLHHCSPAAAVLGRTLWHPGIQHTATMRYLDFSGQQFGTDKHWLLRALRVLRGEPWHKNTFSLWHFYTSNVSVKRAALDGVFFHKAFRKYGWEDTDYALQLDAKLRPLGGLKLHYQPAALAWHHHVITEADYARRTPHIVANARVLEGLHPGLQVLPRGGKKLLLQIISHPLSPASWGLFGKMWQMYATDKRALLQEMRATEGAEQ